MLIDITGFCDLGKYSFGTGLVMSNSVFDTDKYIIYTWDDKCMGAHTEQKITCAADLCKFLWSNPSIMAGSSCGKTKAWFSKDPIPWWHSRHDERIAADDKEHAKLLKRLDKETNPKKIENLKLKLQWTDTTRVKEMVQSLDERMGQMIETILARNSLKTV